MNARVISLAISSLFVLPLAAPQTAPSASIVSASTAIAASAPTPVPALIPYSGSALDAQGRPLADSAAMTFLIYKDEQGGQPLFAETQAVAVDATGHYKVQLGASLSSGIPIDLFSSGEARWIEVQIAGQPSSPRVLLVSVPYALKAADAATLGGLPASAFALAGSKNAVAATSGVSPDGATNVTTTGGVAGYLPEFSGAATVVDSPVFVSGADIGIGTATPTATLDVNGTTILNGATTINGATSITGALTLPATGTATASAGFNSEELKMYTSAYNSSTKAVVDPRFYWEAEVGANDTAAPTATLNLLSSTTTSGTTETGFHFNANGTLNFAPGQTFPGGSGTITGVTAGTALTGGGTTGTVTLNVDTTKVPLLASANSFAANQSIAGTLTTTGSISTAKQLDSTVATGTAPLAVTSTTVVPNLNVSLLNGFASSAFAKVGAANTFTGIQSFSQVGIGTTTPRSLLELSATASKALGPVLTLTNTAGGLGAESTLDLNTLLPSATGTYNPAVRIAAQDVDKDSDNLLFQFNIPGAQNNGLQTNMVIQPNGFVGIGTITPTSTLEVNGSIAATSAAFSGPVTFASGQTFPGTGTITGVTAGTALTGGGTTGAVTLNVDTTKVPLLAASNAFSGNQSITGGLTASGTVSAGVVNANSSFNLGGFVFAFESSGSSVYLGAAGNSSSTGTFNAATGMQALASNTTGSYNTADGSTTLQFNTSGVGNTATGSGALYSNTTGSFNEASGVNALYKNTTGDGNTADGASALYANTTGGSNTAIGDEALDSNTTGGNNTAVGNEALDSNTTGASNTAIGYDVLDSNTTGAGNTAIGYYALEANATGGDNTAGGNFALYSNTTGINNTANGFDALTRNTTGSQNVGVGLEAGLTADNSAGTGSYNTMIGYDTVFNTGTINNATALGAYAEVTESNTVILGCVSGVNSCPEVVNIGIGTTAPDAMLSVNGIADKPGGGSWATFSDGRLKTVNGSFAPGLDQVLKLRPIRYRYKPDNAMGIRDGEEHIGVVAQEVQRVIPEAVTENSKGFLLVNNDPIIWSMVNAIKEQQKEIEELRKLLRTQNQALRASTHKSAKAHKTVSQPKTQASVTPTTTTAIMVAAR